jgi:hypothetical protein
VILQKLVLKYFWPLLRFISLKNLGGFYSRNGEDVLILSLLWSHFSRNNNLSIVEINKPEILPYSLSTVLLAMPSCTAVLINTRNRLVLSYAKDPAVLPRLLLKDDSTGNDMFGCLNIYKDSSLLYEYSSNAQLMSTLQEIQVSYSLVILNFEAEALSLLDELLIESRIFSIMILNNRSGLFSRGDMMVRNKLARKGFVFHTRLNGSDDIFVLTELINGFPSHMIDQIGAASLQRWVSNPPYVD